MGNTVDKDPLTKKSYGSQGLYVFENDEEELPM
jgi:hypothetical protein